MACMAAAQAPSAFNYQAVVRDASGSVLANASVGIEVSLLESGANGTVVYTETFSATTNQFGLVNLEIGAGNNTFGLFGNIAWGSAQGVYMKISIDPTGGTNYDFISSTQLLSVPYALYAKTAGGLDDTRVAFKVLGSTATQAITNTDNFTEYSVEVFDIGNNYSISNQQFVAPVSGIYHFDLSAVVTFSSSTTIQRLLLCIYVNGNPESCSRISGNSSLNTGVVLSTDLSLSAGDVVVTGLRVINITGTPYLNGSALDIHFSGHKVY